jgi:hypothetical protein
MAPGGHAEYLSLMPAKNTKSETPATTLHLAGPSKGPPTMADISALYKALTGNDGTPEDDAEAQAIIDAYLAKDAASAK